MMPKPEVKVAKWGEGEWRYSVTITDYSGMVHAYVNEVGLCATRAAAQAAGNEAVPRLKAAWRALQKPDADEIIHG